MKLRLLKLYVETFLASELNKLIEKPTKSTLHIVSLIDHILTNSSEKVSNYSVISDEVSDHECRYCSRKTKILEQGRITLYLYDLIESIPKSYS